MAKTELLRYKQVCDIFDKLNSNRIEYLSLEQKELFKQFVSKNTTKQKATTTTTTTKKKKKKKNRK